MARAPLTSAVALTTTSTASTYTAPTGGLSKHTINMEWTPGTAANILTVIVQYQPTTGGEQLQEWDDTATAGTFVRTLHQLQHTAVSTAVVPLEFTFERHANTIRIKVSESETGSSTKGTLTSWVTSSN
jgi:hypothetical protein